MGFVVDKENNLVTVDHSHNRFCITTPEGNPSTLTLNKVLKVTSIFTRTKGKRDKDAPGDNSPMLYALKGLHNLKTTRKDIMRLNESYRLILETFLQDGFQWDCIIPLPSSSQLTSLFAKKVCKNTCMGVCYNEALVKITAAQVLRDLNTLAIGAKDRSAIHEDIKRFMRYNSPEAPFQIKSIKRVHLRQHINPLMWGGLPSGTAEPRNVLLVDDMITSGTSLLCALNAIRNNYPAVNVQALTLFGSSK
ncbi:phosphoribosyltransferase [Xenorhabdus bovienii]|uniref:phosphoribosyltransferase n=1 Tax=Xenorhabdus bovienii TaxID=40576 RepID=UPI00237D0A0D|nr:phosphoribosyltransferase [Xenorhabdus bovienii]MDE1474159.1 phosphoribosyltransferase [Xenorhabdus bovienii]MDE1480995.1 phosphoribosyltransferase [Xenorhabdus bovienii]MDE1486342.1 phosphoribosyltransferase [Xenorhabdus bovienii]MDE1495989.1 phosphoribosyltransferase [Xenorhabdus bovienii]MDE9429219.1 phosphoribosyltransferase [Xenorhabdus bovienii]